MLQSLKTNIPLPDARHNDWLLFAYRWAEFIAVSVDAGRSVPVEINQRTEELRREVDTMVDRIMHGMELGIPGMHNQIHQWTEQGFMAKLFELLLENDFQIFLTSDHGNIEAEGYGRPSEGVIAEIRGQRVRIYPDEFLRSRVRMEFPDAIEWPAVGLPDDFLPLFAPERKAFIKEHDKIVGHGGISIEEMIVPFVEIVRE